MDNKKKFSSFGFIQHYLTSIRMGRYKILKNNAGFTLIELLVVIAILGVLAGGVLVAINPLEQLARARDAGRKTTIDSLGKAVQSYYTSQSGNYPTAADSNNPWMTTLKTSGELKTSPTNPTGSGYTSGCNNAAYNQNGYCYFQNTTDAIVYTRAESKSSMTVGGCPSLLRTWIVWSSSEGKTGIVCTDADTTDPEVTVSGLK